MWFVLSIVVTTLINFMLLAIVRQWAKRRWIPGFRRDLWVAIFCAALASFLVLIASLTFVGFYVVVSHAI